MYIDIYIYIYIYMQKYTHLQIFINPTKGPRLFGFKQ